MSSGEDELETNDFLRWMELRGDEVMMFERARREVRVSEVVFWQKWKAKDENVGFLSAEHRLSCSRRIDVKLRTRRASCSR